MPPCATCSSSSLSYSYASSSSHLPLPFPTRWSAHSSSAIFLYQTAPQHRQVHSVSRQQCDPGVSCSRSSWYPRAGTSSAGFVAIPSWHGRPRGAGLHNRPGASRPGRTRSLARTAFARFSPEATGLPWSVVRSTLALTPPHVPEGLAVSCARRLSSPLRGPSWSGTSTPALR